MSRGTLIYAESGELTLVTKGDKVLPYVAKKSDLKQMLSDIEFDKTILITDFEIRSYDEIKKTGGVYGVDKALFGQVVDVYFISGKFKIDLTGVLTLTTFDHSKYRFLKVLSDMHKAEFSKLTRARY